MVPAKAKKVIKVILIILLAAVLIVGGICRLCYD